MSAEDRVEDRPSSLIERLQHAQLRLAALALLVMMCVTVADVFLRYTFNSPIRGSYDLVESTLVVFVFHGIAAVFYGRQNIVIDLIDSLVGRVAVRVLVRISDILSIAALGILAWAMTGPALQAFDYGDRKLELGLPLSVLWGFALAGMVGTILCALAALVGRALPDRRAEPG
ncbi:MAG TPA: TRAP transporter small permease [Xanthobacteraceae bacterium]|jgi:TRAP-type C4-dicarboxylate transport system permease small subunit|nr:TRAP transporter small permease [Xanthobacteraceae bacterium]